MDSSFNPFKNNKSKVPLNILQSEGLYTDQKTKYTYDLKSSEELIETPQITRVFQLFSKYIVCPLKSSMLLIDQHRAHQRILYERFLSAITSRKGESQHLLFPIFITLNPQQLEQFKGTEDILDSLGFQIKLKDNKTLEISGAPELCPSHKIEDVIESILSESDQISEDQHFSYADQVAKSLAKSLSIKTGDSLLIVEQQVLLDDFFGCKETTISPFNKKIFITLEKSEIEQKLS